MKSNYFQSNNIIIYDKIALVTYLKNVYEMLQLSSSSKSGATKIAWFHHEIFISVCYFSVFYVYFLQRVRVKVSS